MNIINRIERLELLGGGEDLPASIPKEWVEFNPISGETVGPPPGYVMTEAERKTWAIVKAIDDSIPPCREAPTDGHFRSRLTE